MKIKWEITSSNTVECHDFTNLQTQFDSPLTPRPSSLVPLPPNPHPRLLLGTSFPAKSRCVHQAAPLRAPGFFLLEYPPREADVALGNREQLPFPRGADESGGRRAVMEMRVILLVCLTLTT